MTVKKNFSYHSSFCSGKILHIDFGDCFEASMTREKFPEKVCVHLFNDVLHGLMMFIYFFLDTISHVSVVIWLHFSSFLM